MKIKRTVKENFDCFVTETSNMHIAEFRNSNLQYKNFVEKINQLVSENCISEKEKLIELISVQLGIENDYMYSKGLQDGLIIHSYLDSEFMKKHFEGLGEI